MSKKGKTSGEKSQLHAKQWTNDELELFAEVLTDDEHSFAFSLEQMALKTASNNEVFEHVKTAFDKALKNPEFIYANEEKRFIETTP